MPTSPSTVSRAQHVLVNGAIGAAIACARGHAAGRCDWRILSSGFGGGVVTGAGKQVAAARFTGAGLLGRQLAAVGTALTDNAGKNSNTFFFPIGPVALEFVPRDSGQMRFRVNLFDVVTILSAATDRATSIDWRATLSAGTPVFERPQSRMPLGDNEKGFAQVGTIFRAREATREERKTLLAHELVHVIQWDSYSHLLTIPLERVAVAWLPGGRWLSRRVDVGVLAPLSIYWMAQQIPYRDQPWEREAYRLAGGTP